MKKYSILALTLVLGATMLCGCRRRVDMPADTSTPTVMPTIEMPTTHPTEMSTQPTVTEPAAATEPSDAVTDPAAQDGTAGTAGTDETVDPTGGMESRRRRVPGIK